MRELLSEQCELQHWALCLRKVGRGQGDGWGGVRPEDRVMWMVQRRWREKRFLVLYLKGLSGAALL